LSQSIGNTTVVCDAWPVRRQSIRSPFQLTLVLIAVWLHLSTMDGLLGWPG